MYQVSNPSIFNICAFHQAPKKKNEKWWLFAKTIINRLEILLERNVDCSFSSETRAVPRINKTVYITSEVLRRRQRDGSEFRSEKFAASVAWKRFNLFTPQKSFHNWIESLLLEFLSLDLGREWQKENKRLFDFYDSQATVSLTTSSMAFKLSIWFDFSWFCWLIYLMTSFNNRFVVYGQFTEVAWKNFARGRCKEEGAPRRN